MIRDFFVLVAIYHVEYLGYLIIKASYDDGDVREVIVTSTAVLGRAFVKVCP